ncbi:MAG: hypothetical protein ACRDNK_16255, partial [Solirubrobacteraceae bacterium]
VHYADQNFPGATVGVITSYKADPEQLKVTVSKHIPSLLGGILGLDSTTVSASAAAKRNAAVVAAALFAGSTSCSGFGVTLESNGATIAGGTHSNGKIDIQDSSNRPGDVTYGGPGGCTANMGGSTYNSLTRDPVQEPWPKDYSTTYGVGKPTCTFSQPTFNLSGTIAPGVYCATGKITLRGALKGNGGGISFVANSFSISASGKGIAPYADNLLLYQTGASKLSLGNLDLGTGWVFAPLATVDVGETVDTSGFVEANQIDVTGGNFKMTGTGPPSPGSLGALTE